MAEGSGFTGGLALRLSSGSHWVEVTHKHQPFYVQSSLADRTFESRSAVEEFSVYTHHFSTDVVQSARGNSIQPYSVNSFSFLMMTLLREWLCVRGAHLHDATGCIPQEGDAVEDLDDCGELILRPAPLQVPFPLVNRPATVDGCIHGLRASCLPAGDLHVPHPHYVCFILQDSVPSTIPVTDFVPTGASTHICGSGSLETAAAPRIAWTSQLVQIEGVIVSAAYQKTRTTKCNACDVQG